ncbi:hypothetical protein ACWEH1_18700 [Micromonospora chersina]
MPWEWVPPVATGLVGIAGVSGTLFASQLQRNTQLRLNREQRAHDVYDQGRQERKEIYVRYLEATIKVADVMTNARARPLTEITELQAELLAMLSAMRRLNVEMTLVGNRSVTACADAMSQLVVQMGDSLLDADPDFQVYDAAFRRARLVLVQVMRLDLADEASSDRTYIEIDEAMGEFADPSVPGGVSKPFASHCRA